MFCNYCRALNPDDAIYCSRCGRTIQPPSENSNAQNLPAKLAGSPSEATPTPERDPDKKPSVSVGSTVNCGQAEARGQTGPPGQVGLADSAGPDFGVAEFQNM